MSRLYPQRHRDALLEGLDNRKKHELIAAIRRIATLGIQQIVTVIDSDLPIDDSGESVWRISGADSRDTGRSLPISARWAPRLVTRPYLLVSETE